MDRHLVVLSGNIAVGKSTLGPHLARSLNASWLPETTYSMEFPHLIADSQWHSKVVAEIAFAGFRTAKVLSTFMAGATVIVAERSLWDDYIFYEMWRDRLGSGEYDPFFVNLFRILDTHPMSFSLHTLFLDSQTTALPARASARSKPYDHLFTGDLILDLERRYGSALSASPDHLVKRIDVSFLDIHEPSQVASLVSEMVVLLEPLLGGGQES